MNSTERRRVRHSLVIREASFDTQSEGSDRGQSCPSKDIPRASRWSSFEVKMDKDRIIAVWNKGVRIAQQELPEELSAQAAAEPEDPVPKRCPAAHCMI
jgi:hypothetical protein